MYIYYNITYSASLNIKMYSTGYFLLVVNVCVFVLNVVYLCGQWAVCSTGGEETKERASPSTTETWDSDERPADAVWGQRQRTTAAAGTRLSKP